MLIDLQTTELGRLRAIFRFNGPREVLVELSVNPVGSRTLSTQELEQVLKTIATPTSTRSPEGSKGSPDEDWEEVMMYVRRCHDALRAGCSEVITTVRIQETNRVAEHPPVFATRFDSANEPDNQAGIGRVLAARSH